jgi:hypothetical protein
MYMPKGSRKLKTKTLKITSCVGCPHVKKIYTGKGNHNFECWHPDSMRIRSFPGTKYPDEDYGRMISEECEHSFEYPRGFPEWCPL